jgi:soluble lytic murein transglycosylase
MLNEQVSGTLNFYLNNVKLIPSAFASEKLLQTSQQLLVRGHDEIAKTMLTIANMNSSQEHKSDLVFHLLASYLLKNDFNGAKDYIDKNIHLDNVTDERLLFWIAKIFEKNNLNSESEKALRKILEIGVYPTYYDYLAAYSLNINSVKTAIGHTIDHSTLIPKIEINHRLRLWGKFKLEELLEDESISLTINSIEAKDNSTLAAIQTALAEQKKFLMLFKMANILETRNYKEFSISSNFLFPDEFKNTVLKNNRSKLDSMLVMALIRQESAFNKEAKSPVGALGLMQIMPATGKSLDRKTTTTHLKTPEKNIKLGIKYLDHLVKRFNSIPDALAAYNAGPHRVSNWRSNLQRGDDLLLQIELIPFKETRNYIKYIFRNYASYRNSQKNNDIKAITHDFFGSNNI